MNQWILITTIQLFPFIHLEVCLTTGPKPLPKQGLHTVRSRASSFKWEYPLLSLRSSSTFLRLLPRLPVTSIPPFIFPSITRCRRQFLRKMWPIKLAFPLLISYRVFLYSLTLSNTSSFLTWSVQQFFPFATWNIIPLTKKRLSFYRNRNFVSIFIRSHHIVMSLLRWNQFTCVVHCCPKVSRNSTLTSPHSYPKYSKIKCISLQTDQLEYAKKRPN